MTDTPHLALPLIDALAQKHLIANEAFAKLDALVMLAVLDRDLAAPPPLPAEGDRYLVAAPGGGLFAGHGGDIAHFSAGDWSFYAPRPGWLCYVRDEALLLVWTGSAWVGAARAIEFEDLPRLGIGTAADAVNRLAVKSDAVLLSHDDVTPGSGDMRVAVNKAAAGRDAGFVFQRGFGTRALFGLLGNDDFTLKVSPDGASFRTGFVVEKDSGRFAVPLAPKFSAATNFDNYIAANAWTKVQFNDAEVNDQGAFSAASNAFTAPFAGLYVFGFSIRFRQNAAAPAKAVAAFHKNGVELGRGRAVSGAPLDDITTFNLTVLVPLAAGDAIDVRVMFSSNDGYIKAAQSQFWGHYVP